MKWTIIIIIGIIVVSLAGALMMRENNMTINLLGLNREGITESATDFGDSKYIECLVKTGDNVGTDDPVEERAGNYKQGYMVLCKPEGWNWGKLERDPKRFAILTIPTSEYNESWFEPEYNYSMPIYDEDSKDSLGYEILTRRKYRLPLEEFMTQEEILDFKSIEYGEEVNWTIEKDVIDLDTKIEIVAWEDKPIDITLHGSAGTFEICVTNASGQCDYSSLSAWEAGEQANLVGSGPCIANITEGFNDTLLDIGGWTTSSVDYIKIIVDESVRQNGTIDRSKYTLERTTEGSAISSGISNIIFDGLQIIAQSGATAGHGIYTFGASNITITNTLIYLNTSSGGYGFYGLNADNTTIYNMIVIGNGSGTAGRGILVRNTNGKVYNSGVFGSQFARGIWSYNAGDIAESFNNVVYISAGNDDFYGTFGNISHCASIDGDGEFPVQPSNWSLVFEDIDNNNFHLKSTDTDLIDAGLDLSYFFTDDIDGDVRTGDWDIGADEYVSAGEDTTPPQWSSNSTNTTVVGSYTLHSTYWTDSGDGLSGYVFEFDNGTGTLANDSFVSMTGATNWSNVTKWINNTAGSTIRWRVYANDSAGTPNWNSTSLFTYLTTSAQCWINGGLNPPAGQMGVIPTGCMYYKLP